MARALVPGILVLGVARCLNTSKTRLKCATQASYYQAIVHWTSSHGECSSTPVGYAFRAVRRLHGRHLNSRREEFCSHPFRPELELKATACASYIFTRAWLPVAASSAVYAFVPSIANSLLMLLKTCLHTCSTETRRIPATSARLLFSDGHVSRVKIYM